MVHVWKGRFFRLDDHVDRFLGSTDKLRFKLPLDRAGLKFSEIDKYATANMDWYRGTITELFDLAVDGKLKPLVAEQIPLAEARRAHELMAKGGYAGKIVLTVDG